MKDEAWKEYVFSLFDVLFHVSKLGHATLNSSMEILLYRINRDLMTEIVTLVKKAGANQFVFMSSGIIYRLYSYKESISEPIMKRN